MKKLTFLFTEKESNNEIFLAEVLKLAVTHTACTKTVVGEAWFNDYINDLSKSDQEKLQISKSSTSKSSTSFKFGDKLKKKNKLYVPFLWMGFNCLKATATSRRQFTFYHSVPRNSWYSFYRPWKDERLSQPWSHPVVLNTGLLDWESSALNTRLCI